MTKIVAISKTMTIIGSIYIVLIITLRKVFSYVMLLYEMGRSYHLFAQQILEIEKLNWSLFKETLQSKKDKQEFDKDFYNVRLFPFIGNSKPIVVESAIMSTAFINYKQIRK